MRYTGMANSVGPSPQDFICGFVYVCVFLCVHVMSSNVELRNYVISRQIVIERRLHNYVISRQNCIK